MTITLADSNDTIEITVHPQLVGVLPVIRQYLSRVAPAYSTSNVDAVSWLVQEVLIPRIAMIGGTTVPLSPAEEQAAAALKQAREQALLADRKRLPK